MTDLEIDPSFLPDTPLPSQDNTTTNTGADARSEPTPAMVAPAAATGAAGEEEPYPFTEGIEDGKPRTQVVVRPRPELRAGVPDEAAPNGITAAERTRLQPPSTEDRGTSLSARNDIDPVNQLVEFVFPTRTFTDWLLVDPLNRGELFEQAIAKDPAGVDAASARARAVGYTAGGFTDALKAVIAAPESAQGRPQLPESTPTLAVGSLSSGPTWAQSVVAGTVPGAHYSNLAQQQYRQGNYGSAAIYGVTSVLDAAMGIASLGASTRIGAASRSARSLAEESFHYTFSHALSSIERRGLKVGTYATPAGMLSPLQAHIDLALPPNRGLTDAVVRIDLAAMRQAGYEIPPITQVAREFRMPGGGYEMQFPYPIRPEFIKIVRP